MVNREKSAVFFSANCDANSKQDVRAVLQIDTEALAEKYLGLPTALGRGKGHLSVHAVQTQKPGRDVEWP